MTRLSPFQTRSGSFISWTVSIQGGGYSWRRRPGPCGSTWRARCRPPASGAASGPRLFAVLPGACMRAPFPRRHLEPRQCGIWQQSVSSAGFLLGSFRPRPPSLPAWGGLAKPPSGSWTRGASSTTPVTTEGTLHTLGGGSGCSGQTPPPASGTVSPKASADSGGLVLGFAGVSPRHSPAAGACPADVFRAQPVRPGHFPARCSACSCPRPSTHVCSARAGGPASSAAAPSASGAEPHAQLTHIAQTRTRRPAGRVRPPGGPAAGRTCPLPCPFLSE